MLVAAASVAQPSVPDQGKRVTSVDCGSVVIIKCERPVPAAEEARRAEARRQDSMLQQLDGVVIEDNAVRQRSIEETMGSVVPPLRPRGGTSTFPTAEGAQCTCMNDCPPWPLPCCVCSGQMHRYRSTPGSSPLN